MRRMRVFGVLSCIAAGLRPQRLPALRLRGASVVANLPFRQNPSSIICLSSTLRFLGRPLMNLILASFTIARMPASSARVFVEMVAMLSERNFSIFLNPFDALRNRVA